MANILELQGFDTEQTPEGDKKSKISVYMCNRSHVSYMFCLNK